MSSRTVRHTRASDFLPSSGSTAAPSPCRTRAYAVEIAGRIGERGSYVVNVLASVVRIVVACVASCEVVERASWARSWQPWIWSRGNRA